MISGGGVSGRAPRSHPQSVATVKPSRGSVSDWEFGSGRTCWNSKWIVRLGSREGLGDGGAGGLFEEEKKKARRQEVGRGG